VFPAASWLPSLLPSCFAACGQPVVVDAAPEAPPYERPLYVRVTAAHDDQEADRTGAAGLVVDCDTTPVSQTEPDPYEDSVSRSPIAALQRGLETPNRGATTGLHEVRREEDRVLYPMRSTEWLSRRWSFTEGPQSAETLVGTSSPGRAATGPSFRPGSLTTSVSRCGPMPLLTVFRRPEWRRSEGMNTAPGRT
jgi:hypothetical protein